MVLVARRLLRLTRLPDAGKTGGAVRSKHNMTTHQTRNPGMCQSVGPPVDVVAWRAGRLREAGFPWELADWLSHTPTDLHELLSLIDAGCPPDLAARILAPIDQGTGPW